MISYIGVDISLTSSAIVIKNDNKYHFLSYMKNFKQGKWTKLMDFITITGTEFKISDNYSTNENYKLEDYDRITNQIILDIKKITGDDKIIYNIEGFSYSSGGKTSSIIDLVMFTSMFRNKMKNILNAEMYVISPSTLKMQACFSVYGGTVKRNKKGEIVKLETKNKIGISGGSFKKRELMLSLNDSTIQNCLTIFIRENFKELYKMANIIKPLDDINDAFFLLYILENDINNKILNS